MCAVCVWQVFLVSRFGAGFIKNRWNPRKGEEGDECWSVAVIGDEDL